MRLTRRSVNLGLATGLATPAFSRIARAAGDTIKVGMVLPVTGPASDNGKYSLTGAKIALDRVNKSGGVLGNGSNWSPRTIRRPIQARCSPSPNSPRSPTLSL
jgi:hypothetical protein